VALTEGIEWPDLRVTALRALAYVMQCSDRPEEAAGALRECVALYEAKGFRPSADAIRAELADLAAPSSARRTC
jgi:hypothetical protein